MTARRGSTVTVQSEQQLPIWPQDLRGLPNALARSALFNVSNVRAGERENFKRRPVAALAGITITYTGEELRQDDEDVFLQILHIARMHELGTMVMFTGYAMIHELGWSGGGASYARLIDCLDRLKASSVSITVESNDGMVRQNYSGSLIRSFRWREESSQVQLREWEIQLEREIIALFGPSGYTRLDWKTRLKLPPMAKWLHSFYHTHEKPFPFKVEKLHGLMGSKIKELRQFRYKLKQALELLVECGFFAEARVDARTDLVFVSRSRDAAQG